MKLVSIDIETTGLNARPSHEDLFDSNDADQILEVGFALWDMEKPFKQSASNTLRIMMVRERLQGNIFALDMNKKIIKEMLEAKKELDASGLDFKVNFMDDHVVWLVRESSMAARNEMVTELKHWLTINGVYTQLDYEKKPKFTAAGKNYAAFDRLFLMEDMSFLTAVIKESRHRIFDVGSVYLRPEDDCIPNLSECCKRGGLSNTEVTHISIDDAVMVVKAAEAYYKHQGYIFQTPSEAEEGNCGALITA